MTALVGDAGSLGEAARALNERREELLREGVSARSASFTSRAAGDDIVRLAQQQDTDLLLVESPPGLLGDPHLVAILADGACDVAVLVGRPADGPVLVAFSGAEHDWAAIELGAWLATARGATLVLAGSTGDGSGRDASRLLANASHRRPAHHRSGGGAPARRARSRRPRRRRERHGPRRRRPVAPLAAGGTWPGAQRARRARRRRNAARAPRTAAGRPRAYGPRDPVHLDDSAAGVDHFAQGGGVARLQSVRAGLGESFAANSPPTV